MNFDCDAIICGAGAAGLMAGIHAAERGRKMLLLEKGKKPGIKILVSGGTPHSFKNESDRPAKMLISVAPAGLEQMFFEVGVPVAQGATTAAPPTKAEIEKMAAAAPKYGIEIRSPGH